MQTKPRAYSSGMKLSNDDPRRSPRAKVFLAATLELADRTMAVVLRDLSEHGALVEFTGGLCEDCEVRFCRKDLRVRGFVAWVHDEVAGICFARPLKPEVVLQYINRPQPRATDEKLHRRPSLTRPGMSAEEQRWAEEMLREPLRRKSRK
jgi:hypothetical protein